MTLAFLLTITGLWAAPKALPGSPGSMVRAGAEGPPKSGHEALRAGIPAAERAALIAIYQSTGGDAWMDRANWLGPEGTEGSWFGVTLDESDAHVRALILPENNLAGSLPPEIGDLPLIETLLLNGNLLTGPIPASLGQLAGLTELDLAGSSFSGGIPPELAGLTALRYCSLEGSQVGGTLPGWLSAWTRLESLNLSRCDLAGSIPPELGSLAQLQYLSLGGNRLEGPIPASFGDLSALLELGLQDNRLAGPVPAGLWTLPNLQTLVLAGNALGGPLPPEVGNLSKIWYLDLGGCGFGGDLPPQLGSLPNLHYLRLERNAFSGAIPPELGALPVVEQIEISGNVLRGEIPAALSNLTSLQDGWGLGLDYNALNADDPALLAFLLSKGDDFRGSQTIRPTGVAVQPLSGGSARLTWTPIAYTWDGGGYRILAAPDPGGPFSQVAVTPDKDAWRADITGLQPSTTYYFALETFTPPHVLNPNLVESERTVPVPFTTASCALSCQASVIPASGPAPLQVQFQSQVTSGGCSGPPTLLWDFGDGETSTGQAPSHLYRFTGNWEWTLTAQVDGQTCTTSGTVEVGVGVATAEVFLGVPMWDQMFVLDGPGIRDARATLYDADGVLLDSFDLSGGHFTLPPRPTGDYFIGATFTYEDHITRDAFWGSYGCPGPGTIRKPLTLPPQAVVLGGGDNRVDLRLPPPLVLLHGALECYRKWTGNGASDPDLSKRWDSAARDRGVLTFTPNYPGWTGGTSWDARAAAVLEQVEMDLSGLRSGTAPAGPVPYVLLGYDMGGLVARAMAGGPRWDDPVVLRAQEIFLLGTPNSGSDHLLGGGDITPLSEEAIMGSFNEIYPDFGMAWAYSIAGDSGWWNTAGGDGPLSLYSAFHIARVSCSGSASGYRCTPYVWQAFDSGEGHIFPFSHRQLGEPASVQPILIETVLPQIQYFRGTPESPAGSTIWGTGARTVGSAQGAAQARTSESSEPLEFPFTISPSSGMGVLALVREGSALFEVFDPSGAPVPPAQTLPEPSEDADGPGMEFLRVTPQRGVWKLRVTPGPSGATFQAVMVENSAYAVSGYLGREAYGPGEMVQLHLDAEGDLTGVTFTSVEAVLDDPYGTPYVPAVLLDDGNSGDGAPGDNRFGGTLTAPSGIDTYRVIFTARGYYQNPGDTFEREAEADLQVIRTEHLFTGGFTDAAADADTDGRSDAITLSAPFQAPSAGSFVARADLYDANGYWANSGIAIFDVPAAGPAQADITFDLSEATCDQFSGPFQIWGVELLDGLTFDTLDYWSDGITTQTYASSSFECVQGTVGPRAYSVFPDQGPPGTSLDLLISGESFADDTLVQFSGEVTLDGAPARLSPFLLSVRVTIPADAPSGYRSVTVSNPGTVARTLGQAFEVRPEGAPTVEIVTPWDGDVVSGAVVLAAEAWGESRVARMTFRVDGADVATLDALPFQTIWDSTTVPNGTRAITAVAEDENGKLGSSLAVTVQVLNNTVPGDCDGDGAVSIGEIQKAINMFLGQVPPGCGVDCSGDGTVSIGEVQKVINAFLGLTGSC